MLHVNFSILWQNGDAAVARKAKSKWRTTFFPAHSVEEDSRKDQDGSAEE
jgi:hypothetical protein